MYIFFILNIRAFWLILGNMGFDATYSIELYPADNKDLIVCVMTGSDGGIGWARQIARRFHKNGISSCALAYWKYKKLPKTLSLIPLETVDTAVKRLKEQGWQKVVLYGFSKGAELSLVSAAMLSGIDGVIAVSPPCAVFEGFSLAGYSGHSAWTYRGAEVPYIPALVRKFNLAKIYVSEGGYGFRRRYGAALDAGFSEENRIKAENAACPILLVSAEDDSTWPAAKMCDIIIEKLDQAGYQYPRRHISFAKASHVLCPVKSIKLKAFPQERKYPEECEQSRQQAFAAAVDWVRHI